LGPLSRLSSFSIQFKAFTHECEEFIPTRKLDVAQQGFNMLEEFSVRAQSLPDQAILFIHQVQHGMEKESQQVQAKGS
jgi:hypothetical protein